ncbi:MULTISPECIES: serine/threonine-protein kinase [unclassified Mycolicibacterium]|uniref:serine/threonine-protein kinase n=1 Tax=unclassified Mycolicibacterium TaxID=2636767 RepID=UPI0012DFBD38|nr:MULTISPECIES: serine/threonine-protein kinase [unclassified Mycolicibacterium]MUL81789.1 serine/threonine protein kinase [Mycolicibacterium sp. CBMA 329]MUL87555.1 serine/threonine protein kinase [Mycolicibacterium sp. CBMA 331]MUL99581.1 serine/threonine protein kinase [Mycolicibacterium sp. CBMA 334]MUM26679.1 serine/threonine protein kinase [Mycolicibacterium sp. CBMA 295]MUM37852.1 serine/threonine protein kinase [Mycolicibacterium sp. CBMA 247]
MPLNTGDVFAGYTIQRLLGSGGMGEVYLAQHPRLPRQDALKIMPASLTGDAQYRERFNREADIASSLWHPHIVGLHDRGEYEGQLWIAMDYVDGTDAARYVREHHPAGMPLREAVEIITAIAEALDYAHGRNLLHRDVKPANILLTGPEAARRRILLADFGVARRIDDISGITATNMAVGSMAYSAPEQLLGQTMDGRADQYALAASTFQLLAGHSPFHHSNPAVVISKQLNELPPSLRTERPELAYLDEVMLKGMAKDRAGRYPLCSDFAKALASARPTATPAAPVTQRPPTPQPVTPPPVSVQPVSPEPPRVITAPTFTAPRPPVVSAPHHSPTWSGPSPIPQPHSPQKSSAARVVVPTVLAVLLVCAIGFAISQFVRATPVARSTPSWQPYVDAAQTFALHTVTVSADTADSDLATIMDGATDEFRADLKSQAPQIKRKAQELGVKTDGTITGAGVESLFSDEAVVLVTVDTKVTVTSNRVGVVSLQRVRVTVEHVDGAYKASKLEFVN